MTQVRRVPYYQLKKSIFGGTIWKEYAGSIGAIPINTRQTISYEKPGPGEVVPRPGPEASKSAGGQPEAQQTALAPLRSIVQQGKDLPPKGFGRPPIEEREAEDQDRLPEFDLQDIPDAMERIGWPVSAKAARKWFAGPSHIYNDKADSVQPTDDSIVTLDWALKFGRVKEKLRQLLSVHVYSHRARSIMQKKITRKIIESFIKTKLSNPDLSFETTIVGSDIRKFHLDWQVQQTKISTFDTFSGVTPTDLSGVLGNFVLYAAIGRVDIHYEKYFRYDRGSVEYCVDPSAQLTHVFVYLKDSYSFNDKDPINSQYLGHWNKKGMVSSYISGANELLGQIKPEWKMRITGESIETNKINWDYLSFSKEVDKPIETRRGFFGKLIEKKVYWPVYNRSYNEWRKIRKRGEDFVIYSKPQLFRLKQPILFKLESICRPYDSTSIGQR